MPGANVSEEVHLRRVSQVSSIFAQSAVSIQEYGRAKLNIGHANHHALGSLAQNYPTQAGRRTIRPRPHRAGGIRSPQRFLRP